MPFLNSSTLKKAPALVSFVHLTWKCASRHNAVQFFISHLPRWLRTRRFSEPTFRPSGATNQWKETMFRDFFDLFAHLHLLSSDSFSSLIFFLLVHIVGSLTSKLPSIITGAWPLARCQVDQPEAVQTAI